MGRTERVDIANEIYHVINRANARLPIFLKKGDYQLLETILKLGVEKYDMRLLAYCIMPNHWHLILQPRKDKDLQKFMQWVTLTHTQRWHVMHQTIGSGHLYQGRYKSFLVSQDEYLKTAIRYVERNPLRAKLVNNIEKWEYGSLYQRTLAKATMPLSPWPTTMPRDYLSFVQEPQTAGEIEPLRYCVNKGRPFGSDQWTANMVEKHKLEATVRERGRPKKGT